MDKWKHNKLHSGSQSGPIVHDQKRAVAIMLSEKKKAAEGDAEYQPEHPLASMARRRSK